MWIQVSLYYYLQLLHDDYIKENDVDYTSLISLLIKNQQQAYHSHMSMLGIKNCMLTYLYPLAHCRSDQDRSLCILWCTVTDYSYDLSNINFIYKLCL